MDVEEALLLYTAVVRPKRLQKRKNRKWVHPIVSVRETKGAYYLLYQDLRENPDKFFNYFRMSVKSFDELHNILKDKISKSDTNMRRSISSEERLMVTLRYLATGCSLAELHYTFRIGVSTLSDLLPNVCEEIWNTMKEQCIPQPTEEKWLQIAQGFLNNANFPNCVGAIDGKHIRVVKPAHSGSLYFNYKSFFSIQLLAICDSDYCFTFVDVGDYGKNSDSAIFKRSVFYKRMIKRELGIPDPSFLPEQNDCKVPYVIIGDEAFGLSNNVMRPFGGKYLPIQKRVFNYRLCRARRYIECSFGILTNKWRIFHRPLNVSMNFAENIVKACVILHNFVRVRDGFNHEDTLTCQGLFDNESNNENYSGKSPSVIREYFMDYFMTIGALPWQNSKI